MLRIHGTYWRVGFFDLFVGQSSKARVEKNCVEWFLTDSENSKGFQAKVKKKFWRVTGKKKH
jgi:hypothetical protein